MNEDEEQDTLRIFIAPSKYPTQVDCKVFFNETEARGYIGVTRCYTRIAAEKATKEVLLAERELGDTPEKGIDRNEPHLWLKEKVAAIEEVIYEREEVGNIRVARAKKVIDKKRKASPPKEIAVKRKLFSDNKNRCAKKPIKKEPSPTFKPRHPPNQGNSGNPIQIDEPGELVESEEEESSSSDSSTESE